VTTARTSSTLNFQKRQRQFQVKSDFLQYCIRCRRIIRSECHHSSRCQNYAKSTTKFVSNTTTRTSSFSESIRQSGTLFHTTKRGYACSWRDLGLVRSAAISHGKLAHKTMSQDKIFANIIAIDNHSEKVIT
jgi:hypothetical protein